MTAPDQFEGELRRMSRRNSFLSAALTLPVLALAIAFRGAIWFTVAGLIFGALGWLFGAQDPRELAFTVGYVAAFVSVIWTLTLFGIAVREAK